LEDEILMMFSDNGEILMMFSDNGEILMMFSWEGHETLMMFPSRHQLEFSCDKIVNLQRFPKQFLQHYNQQEMPAITLNEHEITRIGLHYAGFDDSRQAAVSLETNLERFRSSYGALPLSCSQILADIQADDIGDNQIVKPNVVYLLMSLCWMNTYVTEHTLAGTFKIGENTVRKWCWSYAKAIQAQKSKKVSSLFIFVLFSA
jgi:hypothetical protein